MNKRKIVFISASEITIRSFLIDHIQKLNSKKVEIYLITNFNLHEKFFKKLNVNLINIKFKRNISLFTDFYCLLNLTLWLLKIKPDMVISISPKGGLLSSIASFFLKIKIIEIETRAIGHYVLPIEIFLCEIKNKIHGKNNIYLAFRNKYIVNQFLYSKLKKNFIILPRIIMEPIF